MIFRSLELFFFFITSDKLPILLAMSPLNWMSEQNLLYSVDIHVFQNIWNYAYPFFKVCHPVRLLKTLRSLERSD